MSAAGRRRERPRAAGPILIAVGVVLFGLVVGWVVWFSGLLAVRSVTVLGANALGRTEVVDAAEVPRGRPLARLDLAGIRDRVDDLPGVAEARVSRDWPSGVRIAVTERSPLAVIDRDGRPWAVDREAVVFAQLDDVPDGLPHLDVADPGPDNPAAAAAMLVLDALPDDLRGQVETVRADSPESVELALRDGRTVIWGGANRSADKARVLAALLSEPGEVFDIRTPDAAVVTIS